MSAFLFLLALDWFLSGLASLFYGRIFLDRPKMREEVRDFHRATDLKKFSHWFRMLIFSFCYLFYFFPVAYPVLAIFLSPLCLIFSFITKQG